MKYNQKNHMIQKQGGQGFMSKQVYISADYSIVAEIEMSSLNSTSGEVTAFIR